MEFLSSPIHNYTYETFDDGFFELPKEMDFELNDEFKENLSYNVDEDDDLNDGMYGVWNAKHPWSVNNNSNSLYNSNLHLDFIGGDPESAIMVNPNIVIPNSFQFNGEHTTTEETPDEDESEEKILLENFLPDNSAFTNIELKDPLSDDVPPPFQVKKIKTKLISLKENMVDGECPRTSLSKNGIRVLKPAVVESSVPAHVLGNNQLKSENTSSRLKNSLNKNVNNLKCGYYYHTETFYPKPAFSYSCLIAMALKNSKHGCLPVAEIYNFMCNHFPYFKTAPNGWKNSVRHNLSLNKCFEKIEKPAGSTQRKGCLWALNPTKAAKLEEEVLKCAKKDVSAIKRAMEYPEHLELLERGELKSLYDTEQIVEDDEEEDMDTNEEDIEGEEPNGCEDDNIDERCSESEDPEPRKPDVDDCDQYPVLNINDTHDLPQFNIEVDDSIYEELVGTIKNEQLFTVNGTPVDSSTINAANSHKKIKKYFIQVKTETEKNESEIFDHYDINNLLRFENENKITSMKKGPQRFVKRVCPSSRTKLIKFKNWD